MMHCLCRTLLTVTLCAMSLSHALAQGDETDAADLSAGTIVDSIAETVDNVVVDVAEAVDDVIEDVAESLDDVIDEVATISFWKRLLLRTRKISGTAFILLMVWMLLLTWLDSRHPRRTATNPPVTIVIPCYNDSSSVQETIASVFKAYPAELVELIVINDKSTDAAFGSDLLRRFGSMALCCGLSCIYILPLLKRVWDVAKLFLVIPFSMVYFPMYIVVSFFGTAIGIRSLLFPRATDTQAWDTGPTDVGKDGPE